MEKQPEEKKLSVGGWFSRLRQQQPHAEPPRLTPENEAALKRAAAEIMAISDTTIGVSGASARFRGTLIMPSEEAFKQVRPQFEAAGCTPVLRREEGAVALYAMSGVFSKPTPRVPWAAIWLLVATIVSVFITGVSQTDGLFIDPLTMFTYQITGNKSLISDPTLIPSSEVMQQAIITGIQYTLALLGILGAHEMGHYIVARINKVHTTLPFFIPMPLGFLGTMGAVIAMREPSPNRKVQFDIGIAGPLAGLIVAVPVLWIGLNLSHVSTIADFMQHLPASIRDQMGIMHEGNSLLYLTMKYLVFGQILPQGDLDVWIHPVAFAGWAGLLVTMLNLIPVGQLDGGHILYGIFGEKAQLARTPAIVAIALLAAAGTFQEMTGIHLPIGWSGWWIWVAILSFLMTHHAQVLDEITELDQKRKLLGYAMLVVFILTFSPTPLVVEAQPLVALLRWLA